jgi:Flp pilus assembly pilin Flp
VRSKTLFCRFVENQSGALSLEDTLTVFSLTIGFIIAFAVMKGTLARLYESIFSSLPGLR